MHPTIPPTPIMSYKMLSLEHRIIDLVHSYKRTFSGQAQALMYHICTDLPQVTPYPELRPKDEPIYPLNSYMMYQSARAAFEDTPSVTVNGRDKLVPLTFSWFMPPTIMAGAPGHPAYGFGTVGLNISGNRMIIASSMKLPSSVFIDAWEDSIQIVDRTQFYAAVQGQLVYRGWSHTNGKNPLLTIEHREALLS